MEFLDPKRKKNHQIRLIIGYILSGALIFIASLILLYWAYGFDFDRKSGEVVQKGLVYIDSAPDNASIYINNQLYGNRTNTRLSIEAGDYNLQIKREGYRDWSRSLDVHGGDVIRITYPMLIKKDLTASKVSDFTKANPLRTQSPDRRWLLVSSRPETGAYTEYDLNNVDSRTGLPTTKQLVFPTNLLTAVSANSKFEVLEWSRDNRRFLVKHSSKNMVEFVVYDRQDTSFALNINRLSRINPTSVALVDKKYDKWHLYDEKTGSLVYFNNKGEKRTLVDKNVKDFASYGENIVLYSQQLPAGNNGVYVLDKDKKYRIKEVPAGDVKVDITKYDNKYQLALYTDAEKKTYLYEDPIKKLSDNGSQALVPEAILRSETSVDDLEFSTNTRFVMARDGQHFGVYDYEYRNQYGFSVAEKFDPSSDVFWMDGHRIAYVSGGEMYYVEFAGKNKQKLVGVVPGVSGFFDRDYVTLYAFQKQSNTDNVMLSSIDLRYKQDK